MTGLEFQTGNEPTITYRGPGPDGIVELPSGQEKSFRRLILRRYATEPPELWVAEQVL